MDSVALLERVVDETTRLVDGTTNEQLGEQTPCTEWTVRDLINHLTGGGTMFAVSAEQGSVPDEIAQQIMGDNLGDDFKGAWRAASTRAVKAFERPGALDQNVALPFGEMPAPIALNIAVFDVTTHACDLARATGQPAPSDELLETALGIGQQMIGPDLRQPGIFDAEQTAPEGATAADRLLAFAGRKL